MNKMDFLEKLNSDLLYERVIQQTIHQPGRIAFVLLVGKI